MTKMIEMVKYNLRGERSAPPRVIQFGLFAIVVAIGMLLLYKGMSDVTIESRQSINCTVAHHPVGYVERARFTPDAKAYIYMATGVLPGPLMIAPYKYRVLTPTLVAFMMEVIPGFDEAFVAVNMAALYLFYMVSGLSIFKLGGNLGTAIAGFLGVNVFWHTYNYANPYTVEPVFYLCSALLIYAVITRRLWLFALILVVGMVNKESILFLAPLWFVTRRWREAIMVVVLGLAVYLLPRVQDLKMMGWYVDHYAGQIMHHNIHHFNVVLATVIFTWGLAYVIGFSGARKSATVMAAMVLSTVGALISLTGAADHGRMMASMSPAMMPAIALYFQGERNETIT